MDCCDSSQLKIGAANGELESVYVGIELVLGLSLAGSIDPRIFECVAARYRDAITHRVQ